MVMYTDSQACPWRMHATLDESVGSGDFGNLKDCGSPSDSFGVACYASSPTARVFCSALEGLFVPFAESQKEVCWLH